MVISIFYKTFCNSAVIDVNYKKNNPQFLRNEPLSYPTM